MKTENHISVVIPNYNKAPAIGKCLESAFSSRYKNFEVIVVDDCSEDNSVEIIKKFPCKLICLEKHGGASKARNIGALNSNGEIIFFTDADCLLKEDTLSIVNETLHMYGADVIAGGTYTRIPHDDRFFSCFQSIFINFSETKNMKNPDYIPAHAMAIGAETFKNSEGFSENFLPIIEDVEFSHRLKRGGYRLVINPKIQVQHIFNFYLLESLRNAIKKSKYWTMYSLKNKDLFADSGTASKRLKTNVVSFFLSLFLLILRMISQKSLFLYPLPFILALNSFVSRGLFKAFYETKGILFGGLAYLYYTMVYPIPIGIGAGLGIIKYLFKGK